MLPCHVVEYGAEFFVAGVESRVELGCALLHCGDCCVCADIDTLLRPFVALAY